MHKSHAIDTDDMWLSGCCALVRYVLSSIVGCLWYTVIAVAWNKFLPSVVSTWPSVLSTKKRRFLADEDLSAHSSQRVPLCSAALPRQLELRIVWLFVWNTNFRHWEDFWGCLAYPLVAALWLAKHWGSLNLTQIYSSTYLLGYIGCTKFAPEQCMCWREKVAEICAWHTWFRLIMQLLQPHQKVRDENICWHGYLLMPFRSLGA